MNLIYLYPIGALFFFSLASVYFTRYSRSISVFWMNSLKGLVAMICFGVTTLAVHVLQPTTPFSSPISALNFFLSGMIGLGIGDIFLLRAYSTIGAARTLMIFSFQPLFIGIGSFFVFHQTVSSNQAVAILFLIACTLTISYEKYKESGSWQFKGVMFAVLAVILDNSGVILTRYGFEASPGISPFEGNFIRTVGAVASFFLLKPTLFSYLQNGFKKIHLLKDESSVEKILEGENISARRRIPIIVSFFGSYVALSLWLIAIQRGHLATMAGFGGLAPVFATTIECVAQKKWPTKYLWASLVLFVIGFYILL